MKKYKSLTPWLLAILIVLAIFVLILYLFSRFGKYQFIPVEVKNQTNVNVGALQTEIEKAVGTIVYPGVNTQNLELLTNNLSQKIQFQVPDSLEGVINIYSQDLINRYPKDQVTIQEIKKSDALDQKATVITAKSATGQLTITIFKQANSFTGVMIQKDLNF